MITDSYPVPAEWAARARVDAATYETMYARANVDSAGFWGDEARARLDWIEPFSTVRKTSFEADDFGIEWFGDGVLNVSANCLDRHLSDRGEQVAILWEGDDASEQRRIT